jgi:putative ABC transport system permease protein
MVFTQIPPEQALAFDATLQAVMGPLTPDRYRRYPFATGRITRIDGAPVDRSKIDKSQRWAFDQDVSVSTIAAAPPDANLTAGAWWRGDYSGPPEVILDADIAKAAGLRLGELITVSLLGRPLEARIAGLRRIEFSQFGASFPIILNPAALQGANLRAIAIARTTRRQETEIFASLGRQFPGVNVVSVREQLEAATKIFNQLAWAVRGAAAVAALAGLLVLIGAIASTAQAREREAAILKVLGSGRMQILAAYSVEYGVVGLIAGAAGVALGAAAAYPIVTRVFQTHFAVDWTGIVGVLMLVGLVGGAAGVIAAFTALSRRPAPVLRAN